MISGTSFTIEDSRMVEAACRALRPGVAFPSEVREMMAQCENEEAMCLACEDGMVVVDLRPGGDGLELFVWIAIAFRHGAFQRQDAALDLIGRDLGAQTIAFVSRRKGWARRLGPEWRRRGTDVFVRRVR